MHYIINEEPEAKTSGFAYLTDLKYMQYSTIHSFFARLDVALNTSLALTHNFHCLRADSHKALIAVTQILTACDARPKIHSHDIVTLHGS